MRKVFWLVGICLLQNLPAQDFEKPTQPGTANYVMRAKLLPEKKAVEGWYQLEWWNFSKDTVRELQFHLYLNAFKNEKSTFLRESGGSHRSGELHKGGDGWGYVDILNLRTTEGETLSYEFIQPDDQNPDDQTVIRVPLTRPVLPGGNVRIECTFFSKLPRVFARTGFTEDDFYLVGQWFPKIGVWENGRWNCHQFHSNSEFYADFGHYQMAITVPSRFRVGANALLTRKEEQDSVTTYYFRQHNVIDAVWTASPFFTEMTQTVEVGGRKVEVTYLFSPGRERMAGRYRACVPAMFEYYSEWMGAYPYPNLTIVDVPLNEEFTAGGMEYPSLITTGSFWGPAWVNKILDNSILEIVTFHEFAHNYFQSVLASNEFEEPWLDEGFTTYTEHRALERYFAQPGARGNMITLWGACYNSIDYHRSSYLRHPAGGTIAGKSWTIRKGFYQTAIYSKPALMLITLERYLGTETMNKILSVYFERWKFKHPRTQDFINIVNEVSGRDLQWFFDQFVFSAKFVDYEVTGIRSEELSDSRGWFDDGGEKHYEENESDSVRYRCTVTVQNNGTAVFPVTLLIRFANGDSSKLTWDGHETLKDFIFESSSKITSVRIDPERINVMDTRWSNNYRSVETAYGGILRYTSRWLYWMQSLLLNLSVFI